MASSTAADTSGATGWSAELRLRFASRHGRSLLAERRQRGPLAVQRSFYPEGAACHTYLLHPPGGVVGGDRLEVGVDVQSGAHAVLTTPGATKFYRSAGPIAEQSQHLKVDAGAILEWLPQENIFFPGARLGSHTRVDLAAEASHCGWEIHCLGRTSIGERFEHGWLDVRLSIDGVGPGAERRPWLRDRLRLADGAALDHASGLRGLPVVATLWATPAGPALLEAARAVPGDGLLGLTLVDDLLVGRALAEDAAAVRERFARIWQCYRETSLERPACRPRIWAT